MNSTKKYIKNALLLMLCFTILAVSGCKKSLDFRDVVLITGTETNKLVRFSVENVQSNYGITATVTGKVTQNTTVDFAVDTSLVAAYNAEVSANYIPAPAGSYELSSSSSLIREGSNTSDPISVKIVSLDKFVEGRSYLIPVTITKVSGGLPILDASKTIYLRLSRVLTFKAIDLSNTGFYHDYQLEKPYDNVTNYTFEIRCYINEFHSGTGGGDQISRLCNWGPLPNLLRFGEAGSKLNQLQWVSSGGSTFSKTEFATKTWYTISCTFDGSNYKLYVNGKLDASFAGAPKTYQFGSLELGMSFGGYQSLQRFLGRVGEIRFWNRALGPSELENGLCGVDALSNGLIAYYKMNEGDGQTFFDRTGNGRNLVWPTQVSWVNDDINNKCSQ